MRKTIKEIIEMIDKGKLHYDQSTQRNFIYMSMPQIRTDDGELTRAGNVIRSILQFDVQLPASSATKFVLNNPIKSSFA